MHRTACTLGAFLLLLAGCTTAGPRSTEPPPVEQDLRRVAVSFDGEVFGACLPHSTEAPCGLAYSWRVPGVPRDRHGFRPEVNGTRFDADLRLSWTPAGPASQTLQLWIVRVRTTPEGARFSGLFASDEGSSPLAVEVREARLDAGEGVYVWVYGYHRYPVVEPPQPFELRGEFRVRSGAA